jgi:hypothetical protein
VGQIYEHLWVLDNNRFLPIAKALLHFQISNLYSKVHLNHGHQVLNFCDTIIRAGPNIGEMVKDLSFSAVINCQTAGDAEGNTVDGWRCYTKSEMDQRLRSMLPHLMHLKSLTMHSLTVTQSVFDSFATTPAPFSLTSLELQLIDSSLIDLILPLFPSLQRLHIADLDEDLEEGEPTAARVPLDPPKQLKYLYIDADYRLPSICNLIASTESTETTLQGEYKSHGLASLRSSGVMEELTLMDGGDSDIYQGEEEGRDLEQSLIKFTNLTKLSLIGWGTYTSDHFFTDYFKPELSLQSLSLSLDFRFAVSDLVRAFKSKPSSLSSLVLGEAGSVDPRYWSNGIWRKRRFDKEGMEKIIAIYSNGGVKVSGAVREILTIIDGECSDSEQEEDTEADEESEDEDGDGEREEDEELSD